MDAGGPVRWNELEILVDTELNIGQQCALAAKDLSQVALQKVLAAGQGSCRGENTAGTLCPVLEPQYKRDIMERVQQRATRG